MRQISTVFSFLEFTIETLASPTFLHRPGERLPLVREAINASDDVEFLHFGGEVTTFFRNNQNFCTLFCTLSHIF